MGSNDNFPPPPPPGQTPPPANWPPQQPGFQPTQQVPSTQAYPQQGYVVPAAAPKKSNGLLIGGGLVVVAALVGGVVLLTGGDDDKKTTVTLAPVTSSTLDTATTLGTTVQITTPATAATVAPTVPETAAPDDGLVTVNDDTGTFSIILPNDLELDTTTITSNDGFIVPSISAAEIISDYNVDDTTFGLTSVAVGPDIGSDTVQVMAFLEPVEGTCTGRVQDQVQTALGLADRVSLTGCGAGAGNKVLMVVQLADRPVVIGIYMQGLATIENLQPAAQYALESIFVF